jgi:hypothetical protein
MTLALQAPLDHSAAVDLSKTLWRKQVLKAGTINYDGRKLAFDQAYIADLAASFKAGAYDQVPFVLATAGNSHNLLPERCKGEIRGFIPTDDGLDALIELSDDAAGIVRDNPKLGVSCRIVEDLEQADGRKFPRVVQHVLGTLDPRITGMRPWEAVELSTPGQQVVDLTSAEYEGGPVPELTEDEVARLRALLSATPPAPAAPAAGGTPPRSDGTGTTPPAGGDPPAPAGEVLDPETEAAIAALLAEAGNEPAPTGAALSSGEPAAIDLVRAELDSAKQLGIQMRRELWDTKLTAETETLLSKGYSKAVVDLAKPLLYGNGLDTNDTSIVDLATPTGGTRPASVNVADQVRRLLEAVGPQIDLSSEHPYAVPPSTGRRPGSADEILDVWEKQHPISKGGR